MAALLALLPALLAALFGAWCGTLSGGATAAGAAAAAGALFAALLAAGVPLPDPLRLGRAGRLLPPALWLAAAASAWASPAPRAGRVGLLLLPAFLALPAAVGRCWASDAARRRGLRALAAVVGAVALGGSIAALAGGGFAAVIQGGFAGRPALPLGQHNLLAAWLVLLLPLALLPAREAGRWRWLGRGAGLCALLAILASRSLLGLAAVAVEAALAVGWALAAARRSRDLVDGERAGGGRPIEYRRRALAGLGLLVALALAGAGLQARRVGDLLARRDPSAATRAVYYRAGWRGFLARPALGWGPGATPWTIARFLAPLPAVDPPGEIVPDLHSLPLQLAYELGAPGLLLAAAIAALFARRRLAELSSHLEPADRALGAAALCGLAGGAVVALGSAAVAVAALPLAAALAAGGALAGGEPAEPVRRPAAERAAPALWALLALALGYPLVAAERAYERAAYAPDPAAARRALERAVALDPAFPLYRARLAALDWQQVGPAAVPAAIGARRAAARADRVAPLWLQAGAQGLRAGRPWAPDALRRACALDPLSPFAPFLLAVSSPDESSSPALAARALAAEPRLAAATFWGGHRELLAAAVDLLDREPGIDRGWRLALAGRVANLPADDGGRGWLALGIDEDPAYGLSPHAFRRLPWPARWPLVEVRLAAAQAIDLPSAATLASTSPEVFAAAGCSR